MKTDTHTQTDNKAYKGGPLNRIQAQWVADWLKGIGVELPSGWTSIWKMNAQNVSERYEVKANDVIAAANGEKR